MGAKLLFPNETIQHAGVVVCQDGNPRHLYAGFPAAHRAVNVSRRFQAVTAACMLVRRETFDAAGGFDEAFRNCLEDTDLCLKAGEAGYEVHYCHESVLYHLESVSRGRRSKEIERNAKLFRERWNGRARRDDIDYYVADGLLKVRYRDVYPVGVELAPELAFVSGRARGGRPAARAAVARGRRPAEGDRAPDRAGGGARPAPRPGRRRRRPTARLDTPPPRPRRAPPAARAGAGGGAADPRAAVARRGARTAARDGGNGGRRPGIRARRVLPLPAPDDRHPRGRWTRGSRRARPSRS